MNKDHESNIESNHELNSESNHESATAGGDGQAPLNASQHDKFQSWNELAAKLQPKLEGVVNKILGNSRSNAEDVVQDVYLKILENQRDARVEAAAAREPQTDPAEVLNSEYIAPGDVAVSSEPQTDSAELPQNQPGEAELPGAGLLVWSTKNKAIDAVRKRRRQATTPFSALAGHDDDGPQYQIADLLGATPSYIAGEEERFERKRELGLKAIQAFWHTAKVRDREVFERTIVGESAETIADEMRLTSNHVYQLRFRLMKKLEDQLDQRDPHHSVFTWGDRREGEVVTPTSPMVLHQLFHAGALCPGHGRLYGFAQDPGSTAFRDVAYHVQKAHCAPATLGWLVAVSEATRLIPDGQATWNGIEKFHQNYSQAAPASFRFWTSI